MDDDRTESPATAAASPHAHAGTRTRLEPGARVGRYEVIGRIGEGGMGVVYAARDPELNRKVALKLVLSGDQERMLREAQALARLSHPNVVAIYDVGTFDDRVFIAMELVEGETLSAWLRAGARSWREVVAMFRAAGAGIAAAHAAGIIHRDFKPSNVLVGTDARPRVLDFGLARAAGEVLDAEPEPGSPRDLLSEDLTHTGSMVGTPVYMPPEAFRGAVVTAASDQYSFCVALYEALYGERPYDGTWLDERDPPKLRPAPADRDVPAWLRKIVVRGIAQREAERYPTMDALLAALAADPAVRRRKLAVAAACAVGVLGLGAAAYAWQTRGEPPATDPCANQAPLAGAWDDAARQRLRARDAAGGADQLARTEAAIDHVADDWLAARASVCRGSNQTLQVVQLACLDGQKEGLAALVALLSEAEPKILAKGTRAVHELPVPATCTTARSLAIVDPPPPALRPLVGELRTRLAAVRAMRALGNARGARDLAGAIVGAARLLGYGPLLAEAQLRHASATFATHDFSHLDLFDEAEHTATSCGADTIAARAAAEHFWAGAQAGRSEPELAPVHERARSLLSHEDDLEAEYSLANGEWTVLFAQGKFADAYAGATRAADIGAKLYGADSSRVLEVQTARALMLSFSGRFEEALPIYRDAVAQISRAYGDGEALAVTLDNFGLTLVTAGHIDEASAVLARALAIHTSETTRGAVQCDLSRVQLVNGDAAAAIASCEQGLAKLRAAGQSGASVAINEDPLAAAYLAVGRYRDALATARDCLASFRQTPRKDGPDLVPCLAVEGTALLELGKPADARDVLAHALELQATQPAGPGIVADLRFHLARALAATHSDPARVRELADQARTELARYPFLARKLVEVDHWLAKPR